MQTKPEFKVIRVGETITYALTVPSVYDNRPLLWYLSDALRQAGEYGVAKKVHEIVVGLSQNADTDVRPTDLSKRLRCKICNVPRKDHATANHTWLHPRPGRT